MFNKNLTYEYHPTFKPFNIIINKIPVTVIDRYIIATFFNYDTNPSVAFTIEEQLEIPSLITDPLDGTKIFRIIFNEIHSQRQIPSNLHLLVDAAANDQVIGDTSRLFTWAIFNDTCLTRNAPWITKYFPDWDYQNADKDKIQNELLELQKKIKSGNYTKNDL